MKIKPIAVAISLCLVQTQVMAAESNSKKSNDVETIIITGTNVKRLEADTPQSVTTLGEFELSKVSAGSQADALRVVPGIKVEGGGGEVATNLQVRGLPSTGQFQFTPLMYDGSPTLSVFGLNSSAYDVYYRSDLGIKRVEFVRGGVSNLFGQGSVAGIINYISKTGSDDPEHSVQLEVSDHNRTRLDFATSGAVNSKDGLYYAMSGFYRYDEGPLDTGLPTKGHQIRGNLKKEFDDGSGSLTVYAQSIDDSVQFFLPFPLDAKTHERIPGNDGQDVESVQSSHAANIAYQTANGRYESPISEGVVTKGHSFSVVLDKYINEDWKILAKAKFAQYDHQFNLFLDGDGLINVPETLDEYLANRDLPSIDNANFTYTDNGQAVDQNALVFANRVLDRDRPVSDFSTELNLSRSFDLGDFTHNVTVGSFFSRAEAEDDNVITRYLAEFNNKPRLIDLVVQDVDGSISGQQGNEVTFSQNGITGPAISYSNNEASAVRKAIYIADQMDSDKWTFDLGFRYEKIEGTVTREGSSAVVFNDDDSLAPALQQSVIGTGKFSSVDVSASDFAASAAALYKLNDTINLYGNVSKGFFFPEIRSVSINELGEPSSYEPETITQAELGVKFFTGLASGSVALFKADLDDRRSVRFENDSQGAIVERVTLQSTTAYGIEAAVNFKITDEWYLDSNVTYQDHEFSDFESNAAFVGNELVRKPKLAMNNSLRYQGEKWDAGLYHSYTGSAYANDANSIKLDAFNLFRLDAGYTLALEDNQSIRASVGVFNLFDSEGITEGSPRQAGGDASSSAYFIGRPILPRRVTFRVRYDF
ncbi:TonB-dependent receptor [Catenovulum adriaticum]|uniref:TonB-dependent receptor n=1 Tax=Catenovulum adriaticum TaxID=2984846 RepID=A0ABY7AQ89_9ALTE|nr:TonB-dependent receptor [Catenovulum sp. TS8]WAJ71714.1 TonB-dependent receptor [Catenovulum sp. TS8]